jgi:hypothetical protein
LSLLFEWLSVMKSVKFYLSIDYFSLLVEETAKINTCYRINHREHTYVIFNFMFIEIHSKRSLVINIVQFWINRNQFEHLYWTLNISRIFWCSFSNNRIRSYHYRHSLLNTGHGSHSAAIQYNNLIIYLFLNWYWSNVSTYWQ